MSIILSGCGGGCDLFGAIPYFYKLKKIPEGDEKNLIQSIGRRQPGGTLGPERWRTWLVSEVTKKI